MVKRASLTPPFKNATVYVWQGFVKAAKDRDLTVDQALHDAVKNLKNLPESKVEVILKYGSCLRINNNEKKKLEAFLRKAGVNDTQIIRTVVLGMALETFISAALDTFDGYR